MKNISFKFQQIFFQADIRFNGPTSNELMSTSFSTTTANEWDSDVEDDSNSSEEFMFVKGPPTKKSLPAPTNNNNLLPNINEDDSVAGAVPAAAVDGIESVWNTHHDKVPVSSSSVNGKNRKWLWWTMVGKINLLNISLRR